MRQTSISQLWYLLKGSARIHLCFDGANLWMLNESCSKWLREEKEKTSKKCQKKKKVENSSFFFFYVNLWQGQAQSLDSGRSSAPVICEHSAMCPNTQKTDWTRPPVPDTALHVCHGLLAQIHDRTPQSFRNGCCVCERDWVRERERERGLPWCLHSPVRPLTIANAVLTSVMTYFAMPPLSGPLQNTHIYY